jgi:hypothetical protein
MGIAHKMLLILPSSSYIYKINLCRPTATQRWIPPAPTTSWRIWASWWRCRINHNNLWIPNLSRLTSRKSKNHLIKQTIHSEEEPIIWLSFSRTWCPSNNLKTGTKERWTNLWSPITTRWTFSRPFRTWPTCNKTMREITITAVIRTPYYCNNFSKRSVVTKIARGHIHQACKLFPASTNLQCSSQRRAFSSRIHSRGIVVLLSVETWHQEK